MTRVVRVERKDNCFASNSEKWSVRVHPHFAGQFILGLDEDYRGDFNTVKTGTFQEVKAFAQENFASVYEKELAEIFNNLGDTLCYRNQYDDSLMTYDDYMSRCFDLHLEHDCSLQEILTNDDEYNQVFVSNETGEVYVDW